MKRRDLIAASLVVPGGFISGLVRAAIPCPPPQVNVAGGSSATTSCTSGYSTNFNLTENAISDGGVWTVGDNSGLNPTTGPRSTGGSPGVAFAHAADGIDYLGTIQGRFSGTKHFAQFTVKRSVGYAPPNTQEIELLVGFTLANGVASGYELDCWFGGSTIQPVRWNNGASSNYDFGAVRTVSGSWPGVLSDGDVVRAVFDSTSGSPVITIFVNSVLRIVFTDTSAGKILSGSPGMGFFVRQGSGVNLTAYAVKGFAAGSA